MNKKARETRETALRHIKRCDELFDGTKYNDREFAYASMRLLALELLGEVEVSEGKLERSTPRRELTYHLRSLWRRWKERHRHEWKAYEAVSCTYREPWLFSGGDHAGTYIKYRCDCGKVRTEIKEGPWSLKELT